MKINVSLETLSLPELLRIVQDDSLSGRLIFETQQILEQSFVLTTHYIWFDKGQLVAVTDSSNNGDLIDILEKRDWVSKRIISKIDQLCESVGTHRAVLEENETIKYRANFVTL